NRAISVKSECTLQAGDHQLGIATYPGEKTSGASDYQDNLKFFRKASFVESRFATAISLGCLSWRLK
ncbi:hypothetical protein, partial [Caballeronia sp. BR00000012568055]|uniref:hypothetical protein n=1 Tax=Caballeronia sp. BR00000012568055 TaxID=2918761 RepID=UPI0023FA01F6